MTDRRHEPVFPGFREMAAAVNAVGIGPFGKRFFTVEEDDVTPAAKFIEDLGADSLDTVELVMALEEHFDIQIPDEDAEKIVTVGDAVQYIKDNS